MDDINKPIGNRAVRAALLYAWPLKNREEPQPPQQSQQSRMDDDFPVGWDEVEEMLKR